DLQVTIRENVKFSDGSAFAPADVAATFKMMMKNPKANIRGVPPQAADPTVSGNNVTLHFASPQYTGLFNILCNTFMLKASMADQIAQNEKIAIKKPLGTGPFMLDSYSSSVIKWKPNPNYWGGTPPESAIWTPSIATNAAASDALVSGQLDWAGNDIPISGSVPDAATAKAQKLPDGADVYDILKNGGWSPPATSHYDSGTGAYKSGGNCDGSNKANCWTKGGKIIAFSVYDPVPFSD